VLVIAHVQAVYAAPILALFRKELLAAVRESFAA